MAKCEADIMEIESKVLEGAAVEGVTKPVIPIAAETKVVVVETDAQKEVIDKATQVKLSVLDMNIIYTIYETPYEKLIADDKLMEIIATDPYYMSALTDVSPNKEIVVTTASKKVAKGVEPPAQIMGTVKDLLLGRLKCKPMDVRLINVREEDVKKFQDGETPI